VIADDVRAQLSGNLAYPPPQHRPVAITVKLDHARYEKLKLHGLRNRLSNQDIMVAAFDAYLEQHR
jgi:hypothetical protein